jgi:hypothetical protein
MNLRTLVVSFVVLGVWLTTPAPAGAHRLDEYLQATRLSVDINRVGLEIDLTAGVRIACGVFASIDTNGDGQISSAEAEAYAEQMLRAVVLSVDGRAMPITLVEVRVPQLHDMSLGVGTIRIRASANVPATRSLRHHLSYVNMHRSESSVYLVNVLAPADSRIQIGDQRRDTAQHGLTLDYSIKPDRSWAVAYSLFAGLVMAGMLGVTRWPRTNARSLHPLSHGAQVRS